jgi:hypothetical protein
LKIPTKTGVTMDYYEDLLSRLKILNPGTRTFISKILNREKVLFLEKLIEYLKKNK